MGIGDRIKHMADKITDKIDKGKAERGVDTAADKLDEKTGGKYSEQIDRGQETGKKGVDKLYEKDDDV